MRCTRTTNAPVVTLLSSSTALSFRAQDALRSLFGVVPLPNVAVRKDDSLDALFSKLPFRKRWDSVASECGVSGSIIHFLSIQGSSENRDSETLSMLSIAGTSEGSPEDRVGSSRALLADQISGQVTRVTLKHSVGRLLSVQDVLGIGGGLPLLHQIDLLRSPNRPCNANDSAPFDIIGFREVALPHFDDATYSDGRSLLSTLSDSTLKRVAVGLYLVQDCLALRPLPAALEDRVLPAPSLVFSCRKLDDPPVLKGARIGRIGFSGTTRKQSQGQLMVAHPDLPGLDFRLTDSLEYSSSFAEAQDALLAGSLLELQSENVLLEGGDGRRELMKPDAKDGEGDCWVEFRANVKRPLEYMKRNSKTLNAAKVAKVPDIPYQ